MKQEFTRAEIVALLVQKTGLLEEEAEIFFRELGDIIFERILANEPVEITGLGNFEIAPVAKSEIITSAGTVMEIPAHSELNFVPAAPLAQAVSKSSQKEPFSIEQFEAENQDIQHFPDNPNAQRNKFLFKILPISLAVLVTLAIIVYSFSGLFHTRFAYQDYLGIKQLTKSDSVPSMLVKASLPIDSATRAHMIDSLNILKADTSGIMLKEEFVAKGAESPQSQSDEQYETLDAGHTLRAIATKHYGNGVFWIYIYEENKDQITDPNSVPVGLKVLIPKASKYKINANDPKSVEVAKKLETRVLSEFHEKSK